MVILKEYVMRLVCRQGISSMEPCYRNIVRRAYAFIPLLPIARYTTNQIYNLLKQLYLAKNLLFATRYGRMTLATNEYQERG